MSEPLLSVKNLKTYFYTEDGVMPSPPARRWPSWANRAAANR